MSYDSRISRRREQNRVSQRAFRARKEEYINNLESHCIELQRKHDHLLFLLRATGAMGSSDGKTYVPDSVGEVEPGTGGFVEGPGVDYFSLKDWGL